MKTIFLGMGLGLLSFLMTGNSLAYSTCQIDGLGNINCINNCIPPVQNNVKITLTTNKVNRDSIQEVTYNFKTSTTQGADGLSTTSDHEVLTFPLFRDFHLDLPQNVCQYNPNAVYSFLVYNCQVRSYSNSIPPKINCSDYITPTTKSEY